ncbi:MAG: DUF4013 domain-containing protein [Anaerolineae bacterium]|nr:DUF4013 domain-containing protein [Anaerolineae bacterium]
MDIGKAFTFVFEDEQWIVKILIAAGIVLLGVLFSWVLLVPLIVAAALIAGYSFEITRRVIQGDPNPMPEWDNWGKLISEGIQVIVIGIVYALPAIIVSLILGIPAGILTDQAEGLATFLSVLTSCLNVLWSIVISIVLPAAIAFFAAEGQLSAAFRFGEILTFVRDNFVTYLITFIMSWVASLVGSLGLIVCGLGVFVTAPYGYFVTGHLYGQAYLEGKGRVAQPVLEEELI